MRSDARLSLDGAYRYLLLREWDAAKPLLPFVMLNPSTADAAQDDPTIRRCVGFAERLGYGGILVVNLFAFRATSPADMKTAPDPVGPDNDSEILGLFDYARAWRIPIVAAWGTHGAFRDRGDFVRMLAGRAGVNLYCLGRTAEGHPKHPLYLPKDSPLQVLP